MHLLSASSVSMDGCRRCIGHKQLSQKHVLYWEKEFNWPLKLTETKTSCNCNCKWKATSRNKNEHSVMCVIYCAFQLNVSFVSSRACAGRRWKWRYLAMGQRAPSFSKLTSFMFKSNLRSSCEKHKQSAVKPSWTKRSVLTISTVDYRNRNKHYVNSIYNCGNIDQRLCCFEL